MKKITLILAFAALAINGYGQKQKSLNTDSVFISKIRFSRWVADRNGVVSDSEDNGLWYIRNYKRIDTGIVFVLANNNWLFVFQNRKIIKIYYSRCEIQE